MQARISGQLPFPGCASTALGGSFVCLNGPACSGQNQAGLGFLEHSSVSIQHGRPFMLKELGISTLSGQFRTGKGALGTSFSTTGLRGLRMSSLWLSYGQRLHPRASAGVGLHFWTTSIAGQAIYAPGISFALGLQIRIQEQWKLGARIFHPLVWEQIPDVPGESSMRFECGFAYSFFSVASLYAELQVDPGADLILCGGAEWILKRQILLRTGVRYQPLSFSWGILLAFNKGMVEFSCTYRSETGLSPTSAFSYGW